MWFLLCIIAAVSFTSGMENPAPVQAGVRKYTCCPEKFGYHFVQMNPLPGREDIHLCDFEETKACSDTTRFYLPNALFKRLMIELSGIKDMQAQESFKQLMLRLQTGKIAIDAVYTQLTHKDICHRLFSHLPGCKDGEWVQIIMQGWLIRQFFLVADDKPSCIHQFTSIRYQYPADQKQMLFGVGVDKEFETIRPFPSLLTLSAKVINEHHIKANVPQDLKDLINTEK